MPLADQLYEELVEPIKQAVKQYSDINIINALNRLDTLEYNEYNRLFKDLNNEKNKIITSIPQNTEYLKAIDD